MYAGIALNFSIAVPKTVPISVVPSHDFPRVEDLNSQAHKILHVARGDSEAVLQRGRGN